MTLKIDGSKSPGHIDITESKAGGKSETNHCIYKLEGGTLTICGPIGGDSKPEDRPKEFKSTDKNVILTLKKK